MYGQRAVSGHSTLQEQLDNSLSIPTLTIRCAGYCDDKLGMCYCGHGSKHARTSSSAAVVSTQGASRGGSNTSVLPLAAAGSVGGGRPLIYPCKPGTDVLGRPAGNHWDRTPSLAWADVYGKGEPASAGSSGGAAGVVTRPGWCEADDYEQLVTWR